MKSITPKELHKKIDQGAELLILDVRAEEKFAREHIVGNNIHSINIPKSLILNQELGYSESIAKLPKNKEIIITCTTGNSAKKCAAILSDEKLNIIILEGGLSGWKEYLE